NTQKRYLTPSEFTKVCKDLDIKTVPTLYEGPMLTSDEVFKMAEEDSIVPLLDNNKIKGHLREGVVLRRVDGNPFIEGCYQVKIISDRYLFRENGTEYN